MKKYLTLLLVFTAITLQGELNPKYYIEYQENAPEFLMIEVTDVSKDLCFFCSTREITVKARVLKVRKSGSGLTPGRTITLLYDHFSPPAGWVGPRPIPVLEEGKTYPAFLKKSKDDDIYYPAARGWSFSILKKSLTGQE